MAGESFLFVATVVAAVVHSANAHGTCSCELGRSQCNPTMRLIGAVFALVRFVSVQFASAAGTCGCEHRYDLLMQFYNATNGQNWNSNSGWGTEQLAWYGVTCTDAGPASSSDITNILLSSNNLVGTLPSLLVLFANITAFDLGKNSLRGTIPDGWSAFTKLSNLNLNNNQLTGTLPAVLSSVTTLVAINLNSNSITCSIPAEWSSLTQLKTLDMSSNSITGSMPHEWQSLTQLNYVGLSSNQLVGSLPPEWSSLLLLANVYLASNSISGSLPHEWQSLTQLVNLDLSNNQLVGSLPPEWSSLTQLKTLYLPSNSITGSLPPGWGALIRLKKLDLTQNMLDGSLPPEWSTLTQLSELSLSNVGPENGNLTGTLPSSWSSLSQLTKLDASYHSLSGSLPPSWSNITKLTSLMLDSNSIIGSLPAEWAQMQSLTTLSLNTNQINGTLPASWSAMASLSLLDVGFNQIEGTLPDAWEILNSLTAISADSNQLNGTLPSSWSSLTSLYYLQLGSNSLTGTLPQSWSALVNMATLSLSGNSLSGSLPASWSKMASMSSLSASNNNLSGSISAEWSFKHLINLHLSSNNISGTIPSFIASNTGLVTLDLSHNMLTGALPAWGKLTALSSLNLGSNNLSGSLPTSWNVMTSLNTLDISSNNVSGTLPSVWSALTGLTTLSLASNALNGSLPPSWSQMIMLETLDLSNNRLTSSLPSSWSTLTLLRSLSLNSNNLTGPLPQSWSALATLESLYLSSNSITGNLPLQWFSMASLTTLDLGTNNISGSLPHEWSTMTQLTTLNLNSNNLVGEIPSSWCAMNATAIYFSNNCLFGEVDCSPDDNSTVWGLCGTRVNLDAMNGSCTNPPDPVYDWPPYCRTLSPQKSLSKTLQPSNIIISSSETVHHTITKVDRNAQLSTSHVTESSSNGDMTKTVKQSNPLIPHLPTLNIASATSFSTATSLVAIVGVVQGDPGAAQMLVVLLGSPCVMPDSSGTRRSSLQLPATALASLCPILLLTQNSDVDPAVVIGANIGLSAAVLVVQVLVVAALCWRRGPSFPLSPAEVLPVAALARFPAVSIKVALWLLPGTLWGVVQLHATDAYAGALRYIITVVAACYALGVLYMLDVLVYRRCVLSESFGLVFSEFSTPFVFSPPVPRVLAPYVCSRLGVWGPADQRKSFGSPMVVSYLPRYSRWVWVVGPLVSMAVIILNTVDPDGIISAVVACDGLQGAAVALLLATALFYAVCMPDRSVLISLVFSLGNGHNAIVSLLGLLSRHEIISRDAVVTTAVVGAYVFMAGKLASFLIQFWESFHLAKLYPEVMNSKPTGKENGIQCGEDHFVQEHHDDVLSMSFGPLSSCSEIRRRAALKQIVELICCESNLWR
ncbi:GP46-like surface antigen, putative [Bodo saltans]|uniref:GP46-like surface antigen, putative n=1 Tax=Bodo saltans TaxID=75058 RepID=A0A0S4JUB6_BODSA|nr:GP46-like surface antigen, putative [Bodo saltans]|eukprot:CUG93999.1 GP46-like surface antigen, putative [Bodo saltans]